MEWRLFADLAERAGTRRVAVEPGPDPTARDALSALLEAHPDLRDRVLVDGELASHLTLLVDGEPATLADAVPEDAELALFPPVSGG